MVVPAPPEAQRTLANNFPQLVFDKTAFVMNPFASHPDILTIVTTRACTECKFSHNIQLLGHNIQLLGYQTSVRHTELSCSRESVVHSVGATEAG